MQIKEKARIKGEYTFFSLASWVDDSIIQKIREAIRDKKETRKVIKTLKKLGAILDVKFAHNLIPTVGRTVFAMRLAGDATYTGEVDWGALGTGVSPVFTNASTQLVSEQHRMQAASQAFDGNIAYIDWFVAAGDCANATYTEFAAFIDGTASANSGQAWSLLATGGWVKSGSIFISAKYTINN